VIISVKFTIIPIGKNVKIVVIDNSVGNNIAAELVKLVGEQNSSSSIINESSCEDYSVRLISVS